MYLDLNVHNEYFVMPSTKRHGQILSYLENNLLNCNHDFKLLTREAMSLVYYGDPTKQHEYPYISLVDVNDVKDIEVFKNNVINDLANVVPDILLFTKNRFIENFTETRVAGLPNLVVEVWLESNTLFDRQKKSIYTKQVRIQSIGT